MIITVDWISEVSMDVGFGERVGWMGWVRGWGEIINREKWVLGVEASGIVILFIEIQGSIGIIRFLSQPAPLLTLFPAHPPPIFPIRLIPL